MFNNTCHLTHIRDICIIGQKQFDVSVKVFHTDMENDIPDEELMRLVEDIEASQGQVTPHVTTPKLICSQKKKPKNVGIGPTTRYLCNTMDTRVTVGY